MIATPGRLAELVFKLKKVKLGMVRAVIVDEADQMLCEPYVDELATLMDAIPLLRRANMMSTDAQVPSTPTTTTETVSTVVDIDNSGSIDEDDNEDVPAPLVTIPTSTPTFLCLASATGSTNEAVQKFTKKYLRPDWRSAVMDSHRQLPPGITHGLISIPRMRALEMLRKFLNAQPGVTSAIIFVNDPHRVQVVCDQLLEMSLVAAPLHGDTSKEDRKVRT